MSEDQKAKRFAVRPDSVGFTVYEVWTGQPMVLAMDPQTGLSEQDAQHTADLMNRRTQGGDRSLGQ